MPRHVQHTRIAKRFNFPRGRGGIDHTRNMVLAEPDDRLRLEELRHVLLNEAQRLGVAEELSKDLLGRQTLGQSDCRSADGACLERSAMHHFGAEPKAWSRRCRATMSSVRLMPPERS